jgi:hypothetical protein
MGIVIHYNKLLVFSKGTKKYFYTEFGDDVNIIYGKNTSGKSTLIQLIHYAFGINDEKEKLHDILEENIIVRLECTLQKSNCNEKLIFIRDNENIYIQKDNLPVEAFNGMSGNSSFEHDRLKKYIRELFGFNLYLEQKGVYKIASIETIFLPYYIAQDVGWISLRKSFKGMDFYKNFREDFLDYYSGITNNDDREEKIKYEKDLKETKTQLDFFNEIENNSPELTISKLVDDEYTEKTKGYIENHKDNKKELLTEEKEYVLKCNELSYLKERKSILQKVKNNLKEQNPLDDDNCPVCQQELPTDTKHIYEYLQDKNDTDEELEKINSKIKILQRNIDKYSNNISEIRENLKKEYEILKKYSKEQITYDSWLNHKTNLKLVDTIDNNLLSLRGKEQDILASLEKFKNDADILKDRNTKEKEFWKTFHIYLNNLGVKELREDRFQKLYRITFFPSQGVELHKTILAYNFAFNKLMKDTKTIHRLPFMLDAIFKEGVIDYLFKKKFSEIFQDFNTSEKEINLLKKKILNDELKNFNL